MWGFAVTVAVAVDSVSYLVSECLGVRGRRAQSRQKDKAPRLYFVFLPDLPL